jgi:hypothetical protein
MALLRLCKAVKPMAAFNTDQPDDSAAFTADLLATVRPNGRIVDQVRYTLGGTDIIESQFQLEEIFASEDFRGWTIHLQRWPRDIVLRKGLLSGNWTDISAMVSARDAAVFDDGGAGIAAAEFLRKTKASEDDVSGSVRWAVVLDDSAKLAVMLQGLPATAGLLNGKPSLKR